MSKVDAQRAMREAKYARDSASGPTRREAAATQGTSPAPAAAAPAVKPAKAPKAAPAAAAPQGELCGHKSMNGRACTREAGHPEKNHRYG
ncbi:hypothetical protein [Microlunatus antarcticus]|uniref:Uncharacterized protein n=1 Tax=Microlunatus antarcticus TaxID=53388 RepID=A0A7W5JX77_9ACTN|nr:hypothetical protein [Microlunatus antarcticus]MBB3327918.1 hypothetical protein [Microlunatus antarcticus]